LYFYRSGKTEKNTNKIKRSTVFIIILSTLFGCGVVAAAIAVPIHLLVTNAPSTTTTAAGKKYKILC
jgi:Na+-driven multidrug efflux pump